MKKTTLIIKLIGLCAFLFYGLQVNAQASTSPCTTGVTNTWSGYYDEQIYNVQFTGDGLLSIDNTTAAANGTVAAVDYTDQIVEVYEGSTDLDWEVQIGNSYYNRLQIDLDSNSDGQFDTSLYGLSQTYGTNSGTITLPTLATGDYNLRVSTIETTTAFDPCAVNGYGEMEDYTLRISAVPSCLAPSGLSASDETTTTATISWTAASGNDSFEYSVWEGSDSSGSVVESSTSTSSNSASLTSLTAATDYYVEVIGVCSGGDSDAVSTTFTTLCANVTSFPYTFGFESFDCWTNDDDDAWALDEGDDYGPDTVTEGTYAAFFNDYDYSAGTTADLLSPSLDMSSLTRPTMTFDYYDSGGADYVEVYLIQSDGTETSLGNTATSVAAWTTYTINLESYAGETVQVGFRGTSVWGTSNPHVDNLSIQETAVVWEGGTSSEWDEDANWDTGSEPTASDYVYINEVTGASNYEPSISADYDAVAAGVTVQSNGVLDISEGGSLTISDDFTNSGTVTLTSDSNSYSSIIVGGDATGDIIYERWVEDIDDNGDLVASPVEGQDIGDFIDDNSASIATNNGAYAVLSYDNSDDSWTNLSTSTDGDFDSGTGYAMAAVSGSGGATLTFTGTINTDSQTTSIINNSASGRRWNLVANPYPSFINANDDADATNNFLDDNSGVLDGNYTAVYGYKSGSNGGYTAYNHIYDAADDGTDDAIVIAPGQSFMVAADSDSAADLSFTEAMQATSTGDDFVSGDVLDDSYRVTLKLYHSDEEVWSTRLYFEQGLTLGLNPGYDAGVYDQNAAISTRLVEEDEGINMEINAMSTENMSDVVVPLVINQDAGQEFRVNLHTSTIGEVNIYLEDNQAQTMTLLNEEDFVLTPTSDLEGAGRFYIHLTADTLSNGEVNTSILNAYKEVDENYITIEGLSTQSTSTQVSLFNILGTKVIGTTLDNTSNTQMISTNGLSTGIYVIKLVSGQNQLTKKLIIK